MSILTPGDNKRLNELIGFLWLVAAALVGLSLLSYSSLDPSLNTAAPVRLAESGTAATANWVGITGAYLADLLLQALGYVAFLIPLAFLALAWFWLRSRPFAAPGTKLAGALLLLFSLTSLLGLVEVLPRVHGLLPAGGLLGVLLALGLTQVLNLPGALVVTLALLVAGIFLTTPFSFSGSATWVQDHTGVVRAALVAIGSMAGRLRGWVRWQPWKRAAEYPAPRLRIVPSALGISAPPEIPEPLTRRPAVRPLDVRAIPITEPEDDWENPTGETGGREGFAARRARVVRARYRLPSAALLKLPEHLGGPDEKELQQRAQALTQKLAEFAVTGQVTQNQPRAGGDHLRVSSRSGREAQPYHQPGGRPLPSGQGGVDPNRSHPRQIHRRHRSPQPQAGNHCLARHHRVAGVRRLQLQADHPAGGAT